MLLESAPDSVSYLSGEELVARKVRLLSMMGGNFVNPRAREFNIRYDVLSARTLFERFCLSPRGCVTVDDAGHTLFKATEHGRVRILSIRPDDRERLVSHIENLVERTPLFLNAESNGIPTSLNNQACYSSSWLVRRISPTVESLLKTEYKPCCSWAGSPQ